MPELPVLVATVRKVDVVIGISGQTITVQRPVGTNRYGDPLSATEHTVAGCVIAPGNSEEHTDRADQVRTVATVYAPIDADVTATDRVTLSDGTRWQVHGFPRPLPQPVHDRWSLRDPHRRGDRLMSDIEFIPDNAGLAAILLSLPVHQLVMDRPRGGAQLDQHIAPRQTGEHAVNIHAEDGGRGGWRRDRVMGLVVANAPHSAAVEFGNVQVEPHHVLARTLDVVQAG